MYPLRLSQLRSILIRNLDTRTSTNQSSCSVVDCFCELRDVTTNNIVHQTLLCKETLNPRWVLPQEEHRRLDLATVKEFSLHVVAVSPSSTSPSPTSTQTKTTTPTTLTPTQPPISTPPILSTTVNVLELVPLNIDYATLQSFDGLPLNTVLFEACGGAFYAHPDLVQTLTGKISMSRVPALTELKEQILTSTSASSILEKAFAYQRATDDFERQAQEARRGAPRQVGRAARAAGRAHAQAPQLRAAHHCVRVAPQPGRGCRNGGAAGRIPQAAGTREQVATPCTQPAAPCTQPAVPCAQLAAPCTQPAAPCTQPAAPCTQPPAYVPRSPR